LGIKKTSFQLRKEVEQEGLFLFVFDDFNFGFFDIRLSFRSSGSLLLLLVLHRFTDLLHERVEFLRSLLDAVDISPFQGFFDGIRLKFEVVGLGQFY
jgi:hypothetical protein